MRMVYYYTALATATVPALFATAILGALGSPHHLPLGLFSALLAVAIHSLVILFMLVTGRVLREAQRNRKLGPEFLEEAGRFFGERAGFPAALAGAFSIVAAGVLGYAARGFDISPLVHVGAGLAALGINLWAISVEYRALTVNQELIDRAAHELDRLDRAADARGELPPPPPKPDPRRPARLGLTLAIAAWLPYFYQALILWRGDFSRASLHPWLEASILGAALFVVGRGAAASSEQQS
ncbi:MAG: hypothetical protein CMK00_06490 [Planctomycetes bacterium]|jgi:hypothetical protein|nr:hypothetical protein [Planctomycetota bacterium]HJO27445.1 hypothetical protein [Planctomycetota bacterium]